MRRLYRVVLVIGIFALAGCGGGHTSSAPAVPGSASQGTARAPLSIPADGELFVASGSGSPNDTVYAYPAMFTSGNAPTADRSVSPHSLRSNTTISGLAAQSDGTLDILQSYVVGSTGHCQITIEGPTASGGSAAALANIDCGQASDAIAFDPVGGGFVVATYDFNSSPQHAYVLRYSKSGTLLATPVTRDGYFIASLATDRGGHIYAEDGGGHIIKYKSDGGDAAPVGGFDAGAAGPIAVAPDLTLYAAGTDSSMNTIVNVFTPADYTGSGTPSRTYGPFNDQTITALAVSASGELYVAMSPKSFGSNRVRVYAADAATGKPAPVRILQNPDPTNNLIRGLAIAQGP